MKPDYNDPNYDYLKYWDEREYENKAEEIALKKLLPKNGKNILDIGGGFGRLMPVYAKNFREITIFDLSSKMLQKALERAHFLNIKLNTQEGDVYSLSKYNLGHFDCVIMIRVSHHLDDLPKAFEEISKILVSNGIFILEFANKMHFKSFICNLVRLNFSYFDKSPISKTAKETTFLNFHPKYVKKTLEKCGFGIEQILSVSNLRFKPIKKLLPLCVAIKIEDILQKPFSYFYFGPSIFVKCVKL